MLHTTRLKLIELFAGLFIDVFAIHNKQHFFNIGVVLQQRGRLEGSQRFATARRMPDIPIAAVVVNAIHDGFHGVDLVRAHHQQFSFGFEQHHVTADHLA